MNRKEFIRTTGLTMLGLCSRLDILAINNSKTLSNTLDESSKRQEGAIKAYASFSENFGGKHPEYLKYFNANTILAIAYIETFWGLETPDNRQGPYQIKANDILELINNHTNEYRGINEIARKNIKDIYMDNDRGLDYIVNNPFRSAYIVCATLYRKIENINTEYDYVKQKLGGRGAITAGLATYNGDESGHIYNPINYAIRYGAQKHITLKENDLRQFCNILGRDQGIKKTFQAIACYNGARGKNNWINKESVKRDDGTSYISYSEGCKRQYTPLGYALLVTYLSYNYNHMNDGYAEVLNKEKKLLAKKGR